MQLPQNIWTDKNLIKVLQDDGVVIMPTDTIYGMVGKALNKTVINRIYALRQRNPNKPCIILIGKIEELEKFSIILSEEQKNIIKNFSVPTSFILDCPDEKFKYLHRDTKTLAFRMPIYQELRDLLLKVGPLCAPSANPEGLSPAKNINEAKKYFGPVRGREDSQRPSTSNGVDLYLDGGEITGEASKIIKFNKDGTVNIIRA